MAAKRKYWLQLPQTYFTRLPQRKMRKQPDGEVMQIIYLKMLLACIGNSGLILYQGVYDSLAEEIAEEIDEKMEIVQKTIDYILKNNMAREIEDKEGGGYFFPESDEFTGSESESAERMRRMRERAKTSQRYIDVTESDNSVTDSDDNKVKNNKVREEKELKNTLFTSLTLKEGDTPSPSADAGEASPFTFRECVECAVDGKVNLTDDGIQAFYDRMKKDGWVIKGSPVTNLLLAMRGFAKNHKKYQKKATVEKKTFKEWLQYHGYSQDYYEGDGDFDKEIPISEGTIRTVWEVDDLDEHTAVISRRLSELNKAEYKQFSKLFHKWKNGNERT